MMNKLKLERLPWTNIADRDAVFLARRYLPDAPVIIEAGVCDGEDSLRFMRQWAQARVYGFEAHPDLICHSRQILRDFPRVTVEGVALAGQAGSRVFYASKKMRQASSFYADNLKGLQAPQHKVEELDREGRDFEDIPITIDCVTIDGWCAAHKIALVDYIWLDVEGAELEILKAATNILKTVSVVSVECNWVEFRKGISLFPALYDFMMGQDFYLAHIWGDPEWQGNGIFVRQGRV